MVAQPSMSIPIFKLTMIEHQTKSASELLQRWTRMELTVRCALTPNDPSLIRIFLRTGNYLIQLGLLPNEKTQRFMLRLLVKTANDTELPIYWRSVCLEYVWQPLAKLATLIGRDKSAFEVLETLVHVAHDELLSAQNFTRDR